MVMALVIAALCAACWRDARPPSEPARLSFVARVEALAELRDGTDELSRRMAATMQRIAGLASEAERDVLRADVRELERELLRLVDILERARGGGEDEAQLAGFAGRLHEAMVALVALRAELRHAKTTAEIEAFEELKRKLEGTHDPGAGRRIYFPRDPNLPPVLMPRDPNRPWGELPRP